MATIVGLQTHKGTAELGMMKNLRKMLPQGLHIRLDQEILYGPTHGYQFWVAVLQGSVANSVAGMFSAGQEGHVRGINLKGMNTHPMKKFTWKKYI